MTAGAVCADPRRVSVTFGVSIAPPWAVERAGIAARAAAGGEPSESRARTRSHGCVRSESAAPSPARSTVPSGRGLHGTTTPSRPGRSIPFAGGVLAGIGMPSTSRVSGLKPTPPVPRRGCGGPEPKSG